MNYLTRLIKATRYSWAGICSAWCKEAAFRSEVIILPFAIAGALYFGDSILEKLILFGSWMLVLIIELLNSAIEAMVDRIGSKHHELSGMAKDMGSAAVFLSLIVTAVIWLALLFN